MVVEPAHRYVPALSGGDQSGGGGPKRGAAHQRLQFGQAGLEIERRFGLRHALQAPQRRRKQAVDQAQGGVASRDPDVLMPVAEEDVVDAGAAFDRPRLSPADLIARQRLQFQGDVFGHMAEPGPLLQALDKAAGALVAAAVVAETRQEGQQRLDKTWQGVGRPLLEPPQIHLKADHGIVAVKVWPAIDGLFQQTQRRAR